MLDIDIVRSYSKFTSLYNREQNLNKFFFRKYHILQMSKSDVFVIIASTNGIVNGQCGGGVVRKLDTVLRAASHTEAAIVGLPKRHDPLVCT